MNTKYIIANIKIPLLIKDDGTYVVLSDNTEISFSKYEGELSKIDNTLASKELSSLMSPKLEEVVSGPTVDISRILEGIVENVAPSLRKNITFKRSLPKKRLTSRHSVKKLV